MPDSTLPETQSCQPLPDAARLLSKYGFYFSISVFIYVVLFPFRLDSSWQYFSTAWSHAGLVPYWDIKRGMHLAADDMANVLLMLPLGFLGYLHYTSRHRMWAVCKWWILGLAFGLAAEFIQLAIPTRSSGITDAINNGLGALLGAVAASVMGRRAVTYFTGTGIERRNVYLWMLILCLAAMIGPYDLGPDSISRFGSGLRMLQTQSYESETVVGEEWLRMAGFVLIGAFAVRLAVPGRRKRTVQRPLAAAALVLVLPVILQCARLLVESRPPSLEDLALDILGALTGAFVSLFIPPALQAFSGLLLFTAALVAAGLSPYSFSGWKGWMIFQWIPFYEFCSNRTPAALYEALLGFVGFAILGGFLQLSYPRRRRWHLVAYALVFSGLIEFAQTFLLARAAGITDIIVAGLGAWTGAYVCIAVESARLIQNCSLVSKSAPG